MNDYIEVINDCISLSNSEEKFLSITYGQLCTDKTLVEKCIDCVSDILCIEGFDENYNITENGKKLEDTIDFLSNIIIERNV
jgi:hypothetical protein